MKKLMASLVLAFALIVPTMRAITLVPKPLPEAKPEAVELGKESDTYQRFAVIMSTPFRLYHIMADQVTTLALPIQEEEVLGVYHYRDGLQPLEFVGVEQSLLVESPPGYLLISFKPKGPKLPDVVVTEKPKPSNNKDVVPNTGASH